MKNVSRRIFLFVSVFLFCFTLAFTTTYTPTSNYARNAYDVVTAEAKTETSDDYYNGLNTSLNGKQFRSEVAELITSTHKKQTSYSGLLSVYRTSDVDPTNSNNILWFYTGTSVKMPSNFSGGTNREHVWPKQAGAAFPASSECGSDAHHLRPANNNLNSSRGNHNFGEVATTNGNIVKEAGSTSYKYLCYQANSTFYPGEHYRGATARILMYVQTRWGDKFNLKFVLGTGYSKTIGDVEDLMKWHYMEPPTEEERIRNEAVYAVQGNRNPFIDHPEYATKIYCYDGESYNSTLKKVAEQYDNYGGSQGDVKATSLTVTPTSKTITIGDTFTISTSVLPETAKSEFTFTSDNELVATVTSKGVVTGLTKGTCTITVKEVNSGLTKTVAVEVLTGELSESAARFKTFVLMAKAKMNGYGAYEAIINAVNCYENLTDQEKLSVYEDYTQLLTVIDAYNQNTEIAQSEHEKTTETALEPLKDKKRTTANTTEE